MPEISLGDIVAVAGVISVLPWKDLKRIVGGLGELSATQYPLFWTGSRPCSIGYFGSGQISL
jgi:hypothetical protein